MADTSKHDDIELTHADIQKLSDAEGIVNFFTRLGYDTTERVEQTLHAMNITSETLRLAIRRIVRIASDDASLFEVYLFEVRSLTVSIRNEIVQRFRSSNSEYLLVLTDNYERLDFVLTEHYNQTITTSSDEILQQQQLPLGTKPIGIRSHTLQIERLKPNDLTLRVLRRFTSTEPDGVAQHEKVLNAYVVATWSEPFFNNRALFSDYYLLQRLREQKEWTEAHETAAMLKAYRTLRVRYDDAREECSGQPLSTLQKKVLLPVLEQLGFAAHPGKPRTVDVIEPNYRLFALNATKNDKPLALCLTYPWGRNLDGKDEKRDKLTPDENPGAIVVTLLDAGETDWAIVTNGIVWRLYAAKAHSRATNYYEIHIQETLAMVEQRELAFRYFWLLFRAASFTPVERSVAGETRSLSLLDYILLESDLHARDLGEKLKTRVFEEIFPCFSSGFVSYAQQNGQLPQNLDTLSAEERNHLLEPFFTGTLTFLYRMLFLFYAESRDLLPVRQERGYYTYSLERLKQRIAHDAGELHDRVPANLNVYSTTETTLYDGLQRLFAAVDKGDKDLNMPIYNGGLFMTNPPLSSMTNEPQEITVARFLKEHKIPDRQLALGLDRMARDVDEKAIRVRAAAGEVNKHSHKLVFIDYKSLGVRHLGSIYEGLLEFKLRVAPELMVVVKGKRTEEIIPYSEAQQKGLRPLKDKQQGHERMYKQGNIYLENDRRERKATGSYYTPDYIVKYIVEQTVGPLLKEKLDTLTVVFREAQKELDVQSNTAKGLRVKDPNPEHETYKKFRITINEAFFDIKVLDPAMGSGHFLVEAVDYITDAMAKLLNRFKWNPIVHELAVTRQKIEESMKQQGVSIDSSKLTDLNLLKRRVLKSCIYGVDLVPMAVELTKVSLWLDCFTLGAPLSFLDHHIKCGNSLIGADIRAVQKGIKESLFGYKFAYLLEAAQLMRSVSKRFDVTAEEVAESRHVYQQADVSLASHKHLFDVWLSEYFGNKKAQEIANEHSQAITDNDYKKLNKSDVAAIDAAIPLAAQKHFFHWQLEFPEVFLDETEYKENGGFDAVVGNPPYDELSEHALGRVLDEERFFTLNANYKIIGGGRSNWYHYFMILALNIVRSHGMHSFIVPMSLMGDQFTVSLRKWLLENYQLITLDAFPQKDNPKKRIFLEAKLPTCIYLVRRERTREAFRVRTHSANVILDESPTYYPSLSVLKVVDDVNLSLPLVSEKGWQLLTKLVKNSKLGKLMDVGAKPTSGEIVFNQQFRKYLSEDSSYTLILRGSHVQRYELVDEAKQGEPLYLKKDLYLKEAKSGSKAFDHLKERVVYQEGAAIDNWRRVITTLLPAELICGHKICYFTDYKISTQALLAVFGSKLVNWYVTALSTNNSLSAYLVGSIRFPIFGMTTSSKDRIYYLDKTKLLYQQCVSKDDQECVLGFVNHHLTKEIEASDVVHDLLAFLAEQMLDLNKQKRTMQKEFLNWLLTTLRVPLDKEGFEEFNEKSKLLGYTGDYQKNEQPLTSDALWDVVIKNRPRLGVNPSQAGLKERVLARYEQSLQGVLPLKEQLQRTDTLIDAVVYRLYGLTEEEIQVVEGKG